MKLYENCKLCPRNCGVNRFIGKTGVCNMTSELKVARAALHFWEEPVISGTRGSGAIFFSGCPLHCVFCQNEEIANGNKGVICNVKDLTKAMLRLEQEGANNINFVTPTHYVPHMIKAVELSRKEGLKIPIIYNCGGYESVETLKRLEGIVDVYLPDVKYYSSVTSKEYTKASDYFTVAKRALEEMLRQQPKTLFYKEGQSTETAVVKDDFEENDLIAKGVIVRHLLLPDGLEDSKQILMHLYSIFGNTVYYSLMSQFTPLKNVKDYPRLNRKVTEEEYEALLDFAIELGIEKGFFQEGDVAEESFIPHFDGEGVLSS